MPMPGLRIAKTSRQQWQVPLVVERVQLAQEGLGIEARARQARYQAFARTLLPGEVLVTAQHLDDQCETFLLALKRGSGPAGLSAMGKFRVCRNTAYPPVARPHAGELEQWALAHGLRWIEDESNQDDSYDRNFLRLRVVPLLQQRWPHFADATARSAALCAEQESLLDELLADDLAHCQTPQGTLQIAPMLAMSDARRAAIIRRWLAGQNAPMPSRDALVRIWQEVALAREDASPYVWARLKSAAISRNCGGLNPLPGKAKPLCRGRRGYNRWNYRRDWEVYSLLREAIFALRVQTKRSACVSKRRLLHIIGRNGGRKLKKIWQELGVPPWLRDTTPLLFYGETLIAAAGVFVTQEGVAEGENGVSFVWQKTLS